MIRLLQRNIAEYMGLIGEILDLFFDWNQLGTPEHTYNIRI